MAKKPGEDDMDQRLRWMRENVLGAYHAKHEHNPSPPKDQSGHCTNSGTCIIVCSYINGLGKVLWKGKEPKQRKGQPRVRPHFLRFQKILHDCMPDFMKESNARTDLPMPGDDLLYTKYRCGFVHGYPTGDFKWGRKGPKGKYWFIKGKGGKLTLNIDQLVPGFLDGIEKFKQLAVIDRDLRSKFIDYITAR
jgi:hypothetical protein